MLSSISSSESAKRAPVWALMSFVVTLLTVGLASELLIRSQVLPQDSFAQHRSILESVDTPDAAFGDSHTARGFAAGQGFVNLAFPSEGIAHMAWKTQMYFADRTPGRVILQADPHFFASYRLRRQFEAYSDPSPRLLYLADPRHRARLPGYWTRFVESGFKLDSKVVQTADGALLSPGDFAALSPRAQILEARKRAIVHQIGADERVQLAQQAYAGMVTSLTEQGAEVCMVSYPVTRAYRDAVGAAHQPMIDFFQGTALRNGSRYVDARSTVTDQSLFRDSDHLNAQGAAAFMDQLLSACFGERPS
ncbi:hypothetical protein GFB49_14445 [Epibacterium sp. SM1979]|uniref:Uncharacterized protein n=1 Tax=Tritonibacter litoralis TaxID=2662264 RepID=A0A843YKB9_9RHOB|nr:hypothetical protein [Tritonibacter litoralis]MQQ09663.1 hypothetical protein [Tritonibacter litoralis]